MSRSPTPSPSDRGRAASAPVANPLAPRLPRQVSGISAALARPQALGRAADSYLKAAIATATNHVYAALTVVAALTIVAVLLLMPRRFDVRAGATASAGAAPGRPAPGKPDDRAGDAG